MLIIACGKLLNCSWKNSVVCINDNIFFLIIKVELNTYNELNIYKSLLDKTPWQHIAFQDLYDWNIFAFLLRTDQPVLLVLTGCVPATDMATLLVLTQLLYWYWQDYAAGTDTTIQLVLTRLGCWYWHDFAAGTDSSMLQVLTGLCCKN